MNVKIVWHKESVEFLRRLDRKIFERIVKKIREVGLNPRGYILSLVDMGVSKIRVGDYRIFVNYYKEEGRLVIHSIKHRKNAYKK